MRGGLIVRFESVYEIQMSDHFYILLCFFFKIHLLFYRAHIDSSCITEVVTLYKYF